MPTTYAHWRFGDDCILTMPKKYQLICQKYRDEYNFGVHGPDEFFYYKCYKNNEVNKYGQEMHNTPFRINLEMFKRNYKKHNNKEAALSYILGFLSHFSLDSYCHSYIDHKVEVEHINHLKIESQYDRHLLIKDKKDPIKRKLTKTLKPSRRVCHNIALLYDRWDEKTIRKTLKDMVLYLNIVNDNSDFKRNFMTKLFNKINAQKFVNLFLTNVDEENCRNSNLRLDKYYAMSLKHFPKLFDEFINFFDKDKKLGPYFNNHFEMKKNVEDFPVLSYEDELNYKVGFQK